MRCSTRRHYRSGLARLFSIVELEPGTQLFNEGEEGDKFFVVLQGEVVIIVPPTTVSMDSSSGDSSSGGGGGLVSESGKSGRGERSRSGRRLTRSDSIKSSKSSKVSPPPTPDSGAAPLTTSHTKDGGMRLTLAQGGGAGGGGNNSEKRLDFLALPQRQAGLSSQSYAAVAFTRLFKPL